jgi:cold shock protein
MTHPVCQDCGYETDRLMHILGCTAEAANDRLSLIDGVVVIDGVVGDGAVSQRTTTMEMRLKGTVARVLREKSFGFIRGEDGQEYFFHRTAFRGGFESAQEGDAVTFVPGNGPKGLRADGVQPA